MQRIAYLFKRSKTSSPALAATYPTSLSAALGEEQVYHPGLFETDTAVVKASRGAAGQPLRLKFQGTSDQPDATLLGARDAQVQVVAAGAGQSLRLVQGTGISTATSHTTTSGRTTVTMGTDGRGEPAVTAAGLALYAAANLIGVFTIDAVGSGTGIMGETAIGDVPVAPAPSWVDILSTRQDTGATAAEHLVDAGLGASLSLGFQVQTVGWRAIRALAKSDGGAPGDDDACSIQMDLVG